ncbi:hypothetical protein SAMN05216559_1868 [Halomicrobium zhouii]|uniref:Uncharacterized protein n=1 Tax=Halomicrobium zhouii TaxID=767519 RepID=A0A1I6L233_9EURY|nr:hypothetical protein SAMN05216559_1868 [Halomicrobium zhouii]
MLELLPSFHATRLRQLTRSSFPARFLPTVPPLVGSFDLPLSRCQLLFRRQRQPRPSSVRVIRVDLPLFLLFDRPPQFRLFGNRIVGLSLFNQFFKSNGVVSVHWNQPDSEGALRHHRDATTSRFSDVDDRQTRLRVSLAPSRAPLGASETRCRGRTNQPRAPTHPERAASTQAGFASVDRRETQPKARLVLARGHIHFSPERREAPHARNGRSRATRRVAAASGASRQPTRPNHPIRRPTNRRPGGQKGRGRLGRPPAP